MPYIFQSPVQNEDSKPKTARSTQSDGKTYEELKRECLRKGVLFEDRDFPAADSSLFFSQKPRVPFEWKRPGIEVVLESVELKNDGLGTPRGDCWLLAAIASLTLNQNTLARVILPDQSFDKDYAGIFHFQFWQHNEWVDVIIDDRLPTYKQRLVFLHSAELNEFWSALLEKAYAKLYGSYESLKGGSTIEAMEDFTGGVAEMFDTQNPPENFYKTLQKALERGSMLGCSIDVNDRGRKVKLIRVRNPWGQVEWNGAWSDNSSEWKNINEQEKNRLTQISLDDGEFWMEFEDFKKNFNKIEICNLTPDSLDDDTPNKWEVTVFEGSWVRGSTAGGCRNFVDTFWTNPQFKLHLQEKDDNSDKNECTFIVALMQKNRRQLRKEGLDLETVGFAIYEADHKEEQLTKDFFRFNPSKARSKTYINMRELSERFKLPPGDYVIVPTTFKPHTEANFLLRIFSEKKAESVNLIFHILLQPPKPTPPHEENNEEKGLRRLFHQISGPDGAISAFELQEILNDVLKRRCEDFFKALCIYIYMYIYIYMCCKRAASTRVHCPLTDDIYIHTHTQTNKSAFVALFFTYDTDRSGTMSSYELRSALKALGISLNNTVLQLLVLRYADSNLEIDFDDYLTCIVRLENVFRMLGVGGAVFHIGQPMSNRYGSQELLVIGCRVG
ncbi:Calpain-9 [Acipenser ruthenus]|uniref:Calpain-9 n=1 Tax=Acipenser ruthenus TaxID=7906 RepID=A0A444UJZ7_ACIRT|nr:Calpain-9 [Acipenser ruthenus]